MIVNRRIMGIITGIYNHQWNGMEVNAAIQQVVSLFEIFPLYAQHLAQVVQLAVWHCFKNRLQLIIPTHTLLIQQFVFLERLVFPLKRQLSLRLAGKEMARRGLIGQGGVIVGEFGEAVSEHLAHLILNLNFQLDEFLLGPSQLLLYKHIYLQQLVVLSSKIHDYLLLLEQLAIDQTVMQEVVISRRLTHHPLIPSPLLSLSLSNLLLLSILHHFLSGQQLLFQQSYLLQMLFLLLLHCAHVVLSHVQFVLNMLLPFFQSFLLLPHHSILFHQFQAFTSIVVVSLLKLNHQMQLLAHGQECLLFEGRSVLTGG